ncbi:MAG TPA: thiamine pyrophosphate-dependent enzyme [Burkholderiaceae bacterium]|nr:thiamine pyrophosphate-dependent enzyme [Burkholderiaceae bacterium]
MKTIDYEDNGLFDSGHVACAGCSEPLSMRVILNAIGNDAIGVVAPSCSAMICGGHPISSVKVPMLHTTLESAAASASGIKRALIARGKPETTVFCFVGDGGTYDIGLQALSSAAERNEDILYVCFDNEGYMNTGGQKSSSTPLGAVTGSTPGGKTTRKKNMIEILAAHRIPYIATASPSHLNDLRAKFDKAKAIRGTKVLIILIPCIPGWGVADNAAVRTARKAVEAGVFPLFEIEDGVRYRINAGRRDADERIDGYLKEQKRYSHLDPAQIAELQQEVDGQWARLQQRAAPVEQTLP